MPVARNGRTVLLADDDLEVRGYLETALKCQGYVVELAQDGEEVLSCLNSRETPISAVVLDVIMPRRDGLETLKEIRRFDTEIPIIMTSGASSALNVVEAMKNGANDFIAKPIDPEDLRKALSSVVDLMPPPAAPAGEPATPANKQIFFGVSPPMRDLQNLIGQIGWSEAPVLIQGETGTGKEVLARELHARSPRAKKPILKLNCAALPSELVESELFGYERGAFTGAFQKKAGMFELADGGTILLDEIGDMDFKLQAKLLQVLQDQEFHRLGGKDAIHVDVRVLAATHRDLEKAILENAFREDLYYRLNVINLCVPSLRERREDIIGLAEFLLRKHTVAGSPALQLPAALKELFLSYPWPGNIRELENVIRKFVVLRDARLIEWDLRTRLEKRHGHVSRAVTIAPPVEVRTETTAAPVPEAPASESADATPVLVQVAQAKQEAERTAILAALKSTHWNRRQASVMLQIDYKALLYKMNRLGIKKEKAPTPETESAGKVMRSRAS